MAKNYDRAWEDLGHSCELLIWGIGAGYYNNLERDTLGRSMKTRFSNKRDRMKYTDTPFKRSIPGNCSIRIENL
jgi:nicotinic acid phosphoribosyltransferase